MTPELFSWCEISAEALRQNVAMLRRRLGTGKKLGVVVKADAYGHGVDVVAPVLVSAGVDWLVVNAAREAVGLRKLAADVPIYVCGPLLEFEAPAVVAARARAVVVDVDVVRALGSASVAAGVVTPVHVKVETGTHRQGLRAHEVKAFVDVVRGTAGLRLEGLTTHFADIEDTTDHRFADRQLATLLEARAAVGDDVMIHSANSAATLLDERTHGDLVRVGIAAYGLWPSKETQAAWLERRMSSSETLPPGDSPVLVPVLSWRARLTQVKDVAAGGYVGYGRTFRATHHTRIAIVPVGYHEGYDRRLSNVAHVVVDGVRCPVRGRVCMNMMMIDVTDAPGARPGAVATLIGTDGDERVSAEQLASWMGTIHYEVTSRIHPCIPRVRTV
ncbi:MAG: alanine racemase [Deltaproteobacteria bacterium]|nr:alanine racemase [Deltaproteobacteria bacterium]